MSFLRHWLLVLALLPLFLIRDYAAPSPPAPAARAAQGENLRVPVPIGGPALIVALSDDLPDISGSEYPPDDEDWKGVRPCRTCAGLERMIRRPRSPAPAKWFHRAWGQP